METDADIITAGKYIIIQRQDYTKLHKFSSASSSASLGKQQIELGNIENCKYYSTFKIIPKGKGKNRTCTLEKTDVFTSLKDNLNISESGTDNRNIIDDGMSQKLSTEEIMALRDTSLSSTDIVSTLISNSNTFNSKTEFSQDKYLKKKEKKYFEYVQIKKPSIRLIADIMYRQDPGKILGIRSDTLSQLISYSNVSSIGIHLLYDSGSNGLISAAILNSIGQNTEAKLIQTHPGNCVQKQALLAMNFNNEQLDRCISVNLYSVLRHHYQSGNADTVAGEGILDNVILTENNEENRKRKLSTEDGANKKMKTDGCDVENGTNDDNLKRQPKWELENERASALLQDKVDCLIIASKEHPMSIFKALVSFVKNSRPFVIYNAYQEPLQECYLAMRKINNVTGLKLTTSWMRGYQVLPERTHPDVRMQANSGFLLSGWIVR